MEHDFQGRDMNDRAATEATADQSAAEGEELKVVLALQPLERP